MPKKSSQAKGQPVQSRVATAPLLRVAGRYVRKDGNEPRILVLCAETGMGKSSFMDSVLLVEAQRGATVKRMSLDGPGAESPAERLGRIARETTSLRRRGQRVAVGIDCVPVASEGDMVRELRAIRRMAAAGALVIICLLPEADDLFNLLGEAKRLDNQDFLSLVALEGDQLMLDPEFRRLTHGIPMLTEALMEDEAARVGMYGTEVSPGKFARYLRNLVCNHLRDSLTNEELDLRCAMALLGQGSFDDLDAVIGHVDDELLMWLQDQAPLFGVDFHRLCFETAGVFSDELFAFCLSGMKRCCKERPKLLAHAARVLCSRGQFVRAELLCGLITDEEELSQIGMRWGVELLMSGKVVMVSRSLRHEREAGNTDGALPSITRQAIMELNGRHSELSHGREQLRALKGLSHHEEGLRRYVLAMGDQRDLVAGVFASIPQEGLGEWAGERGARLLKHQRCTRLLIDGAFSTIFDELLDDGDGHEPEDVTGALLCLDFAVAEAMVGGSRTPREQQDVERSIRIIEEASPGRLGPYARALDGAINVIVGDGTQLRGIEYLIARANEYGDVLVEALFLLLAAVGDLKAGAFSRVHVRTLKVCELVREWESSFLLDAALLVGLLSRLRMGEDIDEDRLRTHGSGSALRDLCRAAVLMSRGRRIDSLRLDELSRSTFPRELAWALMLVLHHGDLSPSDINSVVPASWLRVERTTDLSSWPARVERPVRKERDLPEEPKAPQQVDRAARVRITLMGSFSVRVDGRTVKQEGLVARHARDLLALLAIVKGHKVTKRDALLAIWGDDEYSKGMQRLYEATSVVRRVLGAKECGIDPILSSRTEGTIALNPECVSCDVDDFTEEALLSLGHEGSDLKAMRHACNARRWYGGGPSIELNDVTGLSRRHARTLEGLFVSALSSGGMAALRQGRPYLASQLARDALTIEPKREDTTICLVESLSQLGRSSEIEALCEKYRRQTSRGARRRSKALERAFEDALGRDLVAS